jgi:hypothetical protein
VKIYLAICQDRHISVQVYPFTECDAAIRMAQRFVEEMAHPEATITSSLIPGWEYYSTYSCEGDCVYVVGADLDLPFDPATTVMKRCPDCDAIWIAKER